MAENNVEKETKLNTETKATETKKAKTDAKAAKKVKKQPKTGGLRQKTGETISELRKVTWPDVPTVIKKTGIVLAFCTLSLIFLLLIDLLFKYLVGLLAL
jgi:preprotein translocase SecE subunit